MNLDQLEQFVMDTIDHIFVDPKEHEAEAVKSVVAHRFQLHRGGEESKLQEIYRHRRNFSPSRSIEWIQQLDNIFGDTFCLDGDEGWEALD